MGDVSSLIIEELDGETRRVELNGPSLPFQGASWKTKQSLTTTWYPGNGIQATQQLLGPQEIPSQWEGVWRRTLMGKAPSTLIQNGTISYFINPSDLRDTLDDIFFGGSRLRVTWSTIAGDGTSGTVVREGRATEWEFPHDRLHDINWRITFEWYGRGAVVQKVIATRDQNAQAAFLQLQSAINNLNLTSILNPIVTTDPSLLKGASQFNLAQLATLANYPNQLLSQFTRNITKATSTISQILDVANTVRNLPFQLANTVLAAARNTVDIANQYYDTFSRTPVEQLTTKRSVSDLTTSAVFFGQNLESSQGIANAAKNFETQLRTASAPTVGAPATGKVISSGTKSSNILAVHICKQGETPITLSQQYYQSGDHALDILKANKLPWHLVSLPKGKVLIIPVLMTQQRM